MKFVSFCLFWLLCGLFLTGPEMYAQELSKAETKRIKMELKKFKKNPLLYKVKLQKLHKQIGECDEKIAAESEKVSVKNRQVKILNDSIRLMHSAIDMLVEEMEMMATGAEYALEGVATSGSDQQKGTSASGKTSSNANLQVAPEGIAYKVQVGQYRLLDISDYFNGPKIFNYEMVDNKFTYNIGYFNRLEDARRFARDIKKMGITDAFVTKYRAGVRVSN